MTGHWQSVRHLYVGRSTDVTETDPFAESWALVYRQIYSSKRRDWSLAECQAHVCWQDTIIVVLFVGLIRRVPTRECL